MYTYPGSPHSNRPSSSRATCVSTRSKQKVVYHPKKSAVVCGTRHREVDEPILSVQRCKREDVWQRAWGFLAEDFVDVAREREIAGPLSFAKLVTLVAAFRHAVHLRLKALQDEETALFTRGIVTTAQDGRLGP